MRLDRSAFARPTRIARYDTHGFSVHAEIYETAERAVWRQLAAAVIDEEPLAYTLDNLAEELKLVAALDAPAGGGPSREASSTAWKRGGGDLPRSDVGFHGAELAQRCGQGARAPRTRRSPRHSRSRMRAQPRLADIVGARRMRTVAMISYGSLPSRQIDVVPRFAASRASSSARA